MALSEQAKAERNAYMREYRKKNPTKKAQENEQYWERKAQQAQDTSNQNISETERGLNHEN